MSGKTLNSARKWLAAVATCVLLLGAAAPHAMAQGCAMCYQTAAASGAPAREALRHGILILLLPATSLFVGIFAFIYCRRNLAR
ncbi:MAG: hypothetical protein WB949_07535 [Candidatus Acidiferrales bacterium]